MNEEFDIQTKRLIERFKSRSVTVSRFLLIWIPALLMLWVGIESRFGLFSSIDITEAEFNKAYYKVYQELDRVQLLNEAEHYDFSKEDKKLEEKQKN